LPDIGHDILVGRNGKVGPEDLLDIGQGVLAVTQFPDQFGSGIEHVDGVSGGAIKHNLVANILQCDIRVTQGLDGVH